MHLARPSFPSPSFVAQGGALGKAFFAFTFCRGTRLVGGGAKRFTSTSDDWTKSEEARKWAGWLHNPYRLGVPNTSRRGTKSAMAHKWAGWLHNRYCLGGPQHFKAGDKISSGPQVGRVATQPLLSGGSPTLQSGGRNQQWPTSGPGGYTTPTVWGVPNASQRGTKNQKWPTSGPGGYITPAM